MKPSIFLPQELVLVHGISGFTGASKYVLTLGQRTTDSSVDSYSNQVSNFINGELISYIPFAWQRI